MSQLFDIQDTFPATVEAVVNLILDTDIQQRMYRELGYRKWTEERRETTQGLERTLTIQPPVALPGFIRKAFGDNAGYREHQTWDADRRRYTWKVVFDLSDRLTFSGECTFQSAPSGCVRRITGEARARIPLIGRRLEAYVVSEAEKSEHGSARWMAEHLAGKADQG